jgi:hypothetical protein
LSKNKVSRNDIGDGIAPLCAIAVTQRESARETTDNQTVRLETNGGQLRGKGPLQESNVADAGSSNARDRDEGDHKSVPHKDPLVAVSEQRSSVQVDTALN